jgi:hypothetical protein
MNENLARALLLGGPIVFVLAKRLPPGQGLRLPLLLLGGAGVALGAWNTYKDGK